MIGGRLLPMVPSPERTTCACARCASHCRRQPGGLGPGDYEALAAFTGLDEAALDARLVASPGAVYQSLGRAHTLGGITPARKADGSCVWLAPDGRCEVHPVSPAGCRLFDAHMTREDSDRRSAWLTDVSKHSVRYWMLRDRLLAAGRVDENFEQRDAAGAAVAALINEGMLAARAGDVVRALACAVHAMELTGDLYGEDDEDEGDERAGGAEAAGAADEVSGQDPGAATGAAR